MFVGSVALAGQSLHLDSSADRTAFRRWFTFLTESRYYTKKPMREISDGSGLMKWAYREALLNHDESWGHKVELPLFPAMPSVRQFALFQADEPFAPAFVSRNIDEAEPGDLFLFKRAASPSHLMVYIGKSQILPSPKRWVIYLTGKPKEFHKVCLDSLRHDPHPEWRPTPDNPEFLGVWRLDLLRSGE